MTHPTRRTVDAILAAVDDSATELVATLAEVVRIPSVNPDYQGVVRADHLGAESDVGAVLARVHAEAGCEVDRFAVEPGRENAVGTLRGRGGGRSLILNGHVDVVPAGPTEAWTGGDPWSGHVEDGLLYGRGACDMKGALVAQAYAALALRRAGVHLDGDLVLQAVVGEETMQHQLGTTACLERGHVADAAVVGEPSFPPARLGVVAATPGVLVFTVTVRGRRAHPGVRAESIRPGGGGWDVAVNAIDKAMPVYAAISAREQEWGLTQAHPLFRDGQFVVQPMVFVGSPAGQLDPFFIPDLATIDYVVVYHPGRAADDVRAELEALVAAVAEQDGWLRQHPPEVDWRHHWPPCEIDVEHQLVSAVAAAHERAVGEPARVTGWNAVHDGSFLAAAGIPALSYGPGDVGRAHANDECVAIDEVLDACRTYALLAAGWCGARDRAATTSAAPGSRP